MGEHVVKVTEIDDESGQVVVNKQRLKEIFLKPEVRDCKILIYSISGKTRSGKSFLLNNFWRLLKSKHSQVDEDPGDDIPNIFSYTYQCDAETIGVDITAQPFYVCNSQGQECAIFLMDTQGIEADKKSKSQEPDIFALSSILSSFQIINVKERIDWNEIDLFAAYSIHARRQDDTIHRKWRNASLLFLVRDWPCSAQFPHGEAGGKQYYEQKINKASPEMQDLMSCYNEANCFLMPHPGLSISEEGGRRFCDIREVTRQRIMELYDVLFSSNSVDSLSTKAPDGADMAALVERIIQNRPGNTNVQSGIYKMYKDNDLQQKLNACFQLFVEEVDGMVVENETVDQLKIRLENAKEHTLDQFCQGSPPSLEYLEEINRQLQTVYAKRVGANLIAKFKLEWTTDYQKHSSAAFLDQMSRTFTRNAFKAMGEIQITELEREIPDPQVLSKLKQEYLDFLNKACGEKCQKAHLTKNLALAVGFCALGFAGNLAALPMYVVAVVVNEIKTMEPISYDGHPDRGNVENEQDLD
uniref:Atlastin-2-like n=1 Tax=Phallusia mammillata TaxID=59560 RepID=A0A6F9D6Y0_9ASCI|nr:atlastin-2-like [Phallusia mammillata]